MAQVYGQIESLKKIRETLNRKGIERFNSITDINKFIENYETEKEGLFYNIEHDFDRELDALQLEGHNLQKNYTTLNANAVKRLSDRLNGLKTRCSSLASSNNKNAIKQVADWYLFLFFKVVTFLIEKNFSNITKLQTFKTRKSLKTTMQKINTYTTNRQSIISNRLAPKFKELEYTKTVVATLNPVIAGAIGENLVDKELKKLSDTYVLFNDFSLEFEKPIYNKRTNDRIFSIQIDHLLVTNAGIFIIETKNWSKESIKRFDLRSPVQQIQRASYALFVILNSKKTKGVNILQRHHWGDKQMPIRNIVAMINHKPKDKFKFVAIKNLRELNGYINYFEPIIDDLEVRRIARHLRTIKS